MKTKKETETKEKYKRKKEKKKNEKKKKERKKTKKKKKKTETERKKPERNLILFSFERGKAALLCYVHSTLNIGCFTDATQINCSKDQLEDAK